MPARSTLPVALLFLAPGALAAQQPDYSAPPGAPYTAISLTVPTPAGHTLSGTLTLPKGASARRPVPVIVTISGTGPQDRDEYLGFGDFRPFRELADALGRRGIAVLRMDDRGTGASKGTFKGTTHFEFAEDARAGFRYLMGRNEIDTTRMGLLGHSEGALDAAIVASEEPAVRAIVLLAGQARPLRQSLENQINDLVRHSPGLSDAQKDSAVKMTPRFADSLMAADRYMGTIVPYNPAATARQVKDAAVLILTGSRDKQADPSQVDEWAEAFRAGGNKHVTAKLLPDLNHLFIHDTDGSPSNYTKLPPPLKLDPIVVTLVTDWLVKRFR